MSLDGIKVGDEVLIKQGCYGEYISTVTGVTKTLVIVGNSRFNKKGDVVPNDAWSCVHCYRATDDDKNRINNKHIQLKLSKRLDELISVCDSSYPQDVYDKMEELYRLLFKKEKDGKK